MKKALKVILIIISVVGLLYVTLKAWAIFYITSQKSVLIITS